MLCRVDVPQLFQSDSIDLRSTVRLKVEDALQFLRQVPARALREKRVLAMQFHAGLIIGLVAAVARDAHVARPPTLDPPVFGEQHFGRGEPGVTPHANSTCLPPHTTPTT